MPSAVQQWAASETPSSRFANVPSTSAFFVLSRRSDEDVYRTRGASSWFKYNGAAGSLGRAGESFRGACEWVGRADVDVELAVRERRGEPA
jgi:hypothetical protein